MYTGRRARILRDLIRYSHISGKSVEDCINATSHTADYKLLLLDMLSAVDLAATIILLNKPSATYHLVFKRKDICYSRRNTRHSFNG